MPTSRPILALVCPAFSAVYVRHAMRGTPQLPALERLVSYSDGPLRSSTTRELEPWQGELLHALRLGDVLQYPSAPLTWLGASNGAQNISPDMSVTIEGGTWLHATPVLHTISAHGLAMHLCEPWHEATLAATTALVRDHLAASKMNWRVADSQSFLQVEQALDVHTLSATQAMEGELQEALPTGRDATVLRRAMTELQMLLHEQLTGRSAPNAIWLWGAGQMPQPTRTTLPPVWSNDAYTRGVYRAHAEEQRCSTLVAVDTMVERAAAPELLAVIRDCTLETLDAQWFAPALQALADGRLQAVHVYLDGWQLRARRSLVRRLFARRRSLTEWLN